MLKVIILAGAAASLICGMASAAEVEVKLLNKGAAGVMVFEPSLVRIQPGDKVKFISGDKGHNVESIPGMLPAGATPVEGKMSEDISVTFDKPGAYGFRCKPHYGMGMVALVVVGTPDNLDTAKAVTHPGKAKSTFATLFDQAAAKAASN